MAKQSLLQFLFLLSIINRIGKWNCFDWLSAQHFEISILFPDSQQPRVCCFANYVVSPCFKWCAENTCDNLLNPPSNCTADCESNVCVCADGLYRNVCNLCVTADQCNTTCQRYEPLVCPDPNEILNTCFIPTNAKVCPNVQRSTPRDMFLKYISPSQPGLCALSVCDCKDGYLRNKCGQCVLESDCSRKCCVHESDPCSQPGEVRETKYCKRRRTSRRSRRRRSPFSSKRKCRERRYTKKSECNCQNGLSRDKCGRCLPPNILNCTSVCTCSNPCVQNPIEGFRWECLNECNVRYCFNYYEIEVFKNKTCPTECFYGCQCSSNDNLWFNGTNCVPPEECGSYEASLVIKQLAAEYIRAIDYAQLSKGFLDYLLQTVYGI